MTPYIFAERVDTFAGPAFRVGTICATEAEALSVCEMLRNRKPPQAFQPEPETKETTLTAGELLAQGQHEAALDETECTGAACLLTRGGD